MINDTRPSLRLAQIREAVERHREEFVLVHAVSEAANESNSLSSVLSEVTQMVCEYMGWPIGHAFTVMPETVPTTRSLDVWYLEDPAIHDVFRAATEEMRSSDALGHLCCGLAPFSLHDVANCPKFRRREVARQLGLNHYYAIPILSETEVIGGVEFLASRPAAQTHARLDSLLASIGTALRRVAERELRERQRHLLVRTELAREEAVQRAAELQRLAAELHRRNHELDQFAYVASHDLRAPLRGIANLAGWIAQDLEPHLTDDTRRYLDLLKGRVNRMEALISGLLEYSRAGRRATPEELIDVPTMVREIADLLQASRRSPAEQASRRSPAEQASRRSPAEQASRRSAAEQASRRSPAEQASRRSATERASAVEWQIGTLPRVRGPRVLLRQVFHNLLANAVKYATVAHPRIEVGAEREGPGVWRFFVRDNGPGIAACYQAKIWEIFQTLQPRDDVESTGIGLSLVRKIVEQRGGEVGVDSAPGHGACFSFTWPEQRLQHGTEARQEQVPEYISK